MVSASPRHPDQTAILRSRPPTRWNTLSPIVEGSGREDIPSGCARCGPNRADPGASGFLSVSGPGVRFRSQTGAASVSTWVRDGARVGGGRCVGRSVCSWRSTVYSPSAGNRCTRSGCEAIRIENEGDRGTRRVELRPETSRQESDHRRKRDPTHDPEEELIGR